MVGTIETIYLGCVERKSEKGNAYKVVTFMDDGEAVNAMLSKDFKGELPHALTETTVTIRVQLGRYQKVEVLAFGE